MSKIKIVVRNNNKERDYGFNNLPLRGPCVINTDWNVKEDVMIITITKYNDVKIVGELKHF